MTTGELLHRVLHTRLLQPIERNGAALPSVPDLVVEDQISGTQGAHLLEAQGFPARRARSEWSY